jgi:hypothetical protein
VNRAETPGLAANLRRVATELRRSTPFRGLLALRCGQKIQQVKRLSATGIKRPSVRDGFNCRMKQLYEVRQRAWSMRRSRSVAKFQRSKALAAGLCFAHGSNINARDESCGKLKASGCRTKSLAAKSGQGGCAKFLLRICQIQPGRVTAKLSG